MTGRGFCRASKSPSPGAREESMRPPPRPILPPVGASQDDLLPVDCRQQGAGPIGESIDHSTVRIRILLLAWKPVRAGGQPREAQTRRAQRGAVIPPAGARSAGGITGLRALSFPAATGSGTVTKLGPRSRRTHGFVAQSPRKKARGAESQQLLFRLDRQRVLPPARRLGLHW